MTGRVMAADNGAAPLTWAPRKGPYPMGLMAVLATVSMLFAAFTAAMLIRRTGSDWEHVALPSIVWVNTVVIVLSSVAMEWARWAARHNPDAVVRGMVATSLLGVLFLAGQVAAWQTLAANGVFLPTSPNASFFYMLTAVHGAHVMGGLVALGWTLGRAMKGAYTARQHTGLTHAAVYWHFVGVVWVYLAVALTTF